MSKSILPKLLCAASVLFPGQLMAQAYWDGSTDEEWAGEGTASSPYLITSAAELAGLAKRTNKGETFEGKYIQLAADIWLSDDSKPADERPLWVPIASMDISNDDAETNPGNWYMEEHLFKGVFDGAGHTIHNLWFNGSTNFDDFNDPFGSGQIDFTAYNKALFGSLEGAEIKNLNVKNVNVSGALVAGFAMQAKETSFTDVYIDGHVKAGDLKNGGTAAGLVQNAYNCTFLRCESNVDVYSKSSAAPFVSSLKAGSTVTDCKAGGTATGCVYVSGFIASATAWEEGNDLRTPVIRNCSSSGLVTVIPGRNQGNYGGGFIGINSGDIYNCYSTSDLHVTVDVGAGFCVENRGRIESCYALGNLYNEEYGVSLSAFVSDNGLDAGWSEYYPGTILNCYATGSLTAPEAPTDIIAVPTQIYGFCGYNVVQAGSQMANCYYDSSKNPTLWQSALGSSGISTEYMKSKEFVDDLNHMAAIMGTALWEYVEGGYPVPTEVKATVIEPFFAGGKGTEAEPYLISTKKHLENLAFAANHNWNFIGQHFLQTADIALNEPMENWGEKMPEQWTPIANYGYESEGNAASHRFCGVYDGGLHTISNMYIDNEELVYAGLFGAIGKDAVIKNLGVTDAWIAAKGYAGPIAGAVRIHNEYNQFEGNVSILHCWTSGEITKCTSGGIVGDSNAGGMTYIDGCYSTVNYSTHGLVGSSYINVTELNGCWFSGETNNTFFNPGYEILFWTFANGDYKTNYYKEDYLLSTAYMQSKQFVNDLNYAAAAKDFEGGWCYNERNYPAFTGEAPTLTVKLEEGTGSNITFKAFKGSSLSKPSDPQREGYRMLGWYKDTAFTEPFEFGVTELTSDVTLYARWAEDVAPDYSIFQNKFAKTFTITTPAQLYAFSNIVSGTAEGIDRSDFEGKTVRLGNDIELNDVADYEHWGNGITPLEFPGIGSSNSNYGFNGTFDGQGHAIIGLYSDWALFAVIQQQGSVKNLILKNAYINIPYSTALLVHELYGSLVQCGAEGKIVSDTRGTYDFNKIAGLVSEVKDSGSVEQCYADVDIICDGNGVAGLIGTNRGKIADSYAAGVIGSITPGNFGGVVCTNSGSVEGCYSAITLKWDNTPDNINGYWGGLYGANSNSITPAGYFDKNLVEEAFKMFPADWNSWTGRDYFEEAMNKGTGLSTADMKKMASFEGWNFTDVWGRRNDINDGYPYLRWTAPGLANDTDQSGVESIEATDDAEVIIYDLQGLPIYRGAEGGYSLPAGIYIKRAGSASTKIVVK